MKKMSSMRMKTKKVKVMLLIDYHLISKLDSLLMLVA